MTHKLKRIARIALIILGVITLYVAWVYLQPDESLSPELQAALSQRAKALPDVETAAVALLGLEAPESEDFMVYGRKMLAAQRAGQDWNDAATQASNGKAGLQFKNRPEVECWLYDKDEEIPAGIRNNCGSAELIAEYLKDNATMMSRYRIGQKMPRAAGNVQFRGQPTILLSKMNVVEIADDVSRGMAERAYVKWRDHYVHQKQMAGNGSGWVLTAINLVNEQLSFTGLDVLLKHAPQLADRHRDELLALLKPSGLARYDVPGIILGETEVVAYYLGTPSLSRWVRINRLRNRRFESASEFIHVVLQPSADLRGKLAALRLSTKKTQGLRLADALDPTSAVVWMRIRDADTKAAELVDAMVRSEGYLRLFTIELRLASEKISDEKITAFLNDAAEPLRNPWDGTPATWDSHRRILSMKHPDKDSRVEVHL